MIEGGRLPGARVVTHVARLGETACHMVRIRRALEIFQVTGHAGRAGQVVVVVNVAVGALTRRNCVRTGQHKIHKRMIKSCRLPSGRRVALRTIRREVRCDVIGIRGPLEIFQVAADAGRAGQIVIVVHVAIDALTWRNSVPSAQREPDRTVIEIRVQPCVRSMAGCAVRGEPSLRVIWIARRFEFIQVTRHALGGHRLELTLRCALMARIAIYGCMGSGQRKTIIVLLDLLDRNLPSAHGVTLLAIRSELALVYVGMAVLTTLPHVRKDRLRVALHARH